MNRPNGWNQWQEPTNIDSNGLPRCPNPRCGCNKSEVTHTEIMNDGTGRRRRRRVCDHCREPFFTIQPPEQVQ